MQEELSKSFRTLDCMGVDVRVFQNIRRLVELDLAIIRMRNVQSPAGLFMRRLF